MKKEKIYKGMYGYLKKRKSGLLTRALALLAGMIGLVVLGVVTLGTKNNWLTIVACVSAIPMGMQAATYLALRKYHGRPEEEFRSIQKLVGNGVLDTELIVADRDGDNVELNYVYVHETGIYAYTINEKADLHKQADYIRNFLRLEGLDGDLMLYRDLHAYKKRLATLEPSDRNTIDDFYLRQEGVILSISM